MDPLLESVNSLYFFIVGVGTAGKKVGNSSLLISTGSLISSQGF